MGFPTKFAIFLLLPCFALAAINITAQPFQLAGETNISCFKLTWSLVDGATSYDILHGSSGDQVASVPGNTFDIYDLAATDTYQIAAMKGSSKLDSSASVTVTPRNPGTGQYRLYDNTRVSSLRLPATIVSKGVYYRHGYVTDTDGFLRISQQTSTDGYTFTGDATVLTRADVCESIVNKTCKLESIAFVQNPATEQIIMWAHLENKLDYTLGQVAVAYGDPGANWTFGGTFQPEGDDSRDLTFFADPTNGKGYVISAIHNNQDLGLYATNDGWTNITSRVATLQPGEKREAPAMVYADGYYYLFTSTAAGWYPSQGKYISAQDISGPWKASTNVGNIANFGAQSGGIIQIGNFSVMSANRWAGSWKIPETTRQILLPISFSNGFASYNFYDTIGYDGDNGDIIPIQHGKILSVGKTSNASGTQGTSNAPALANNGIQDDPDDVFVPAKVPFWWQVDLGDAHQISQVDVTAKQIAGSEVYLQYNVTGSAQQNDSDGTLLLDKSKNTVVGFVAGNVTETGTYRYIRVSVNKVINVQNGNEADFSAGLVEVTVSGN